MDCNFEDPSCVQRQPDLIDFLPETSVDSWTDSHQNNEPPIFKSKDRADSCSDVVAIKSESGDIAFVAVRRPQPVERTQQTALSYVTKRKHRKTRSAAEKEGTHSSSFPRITRDPSGGIDNLGYTTISRNESYSYDDTGFNYHSHHEHWSDRGFLNLDSRSRHHYQPQYVAINNTHASSPEISSGGFTIDDGQAPEISNDVFGSAFPPGAPSTSQSVAVSADTAGQRSPLGGSRQSLNGLENATVDSSVEQSQSSNSSQRQSNSPDLEPTSQISTPPPKLPPLCKVCGQCHGVTENHEYNYIDEVDEDLMCDICLQPLVEPYDTQCGHTFCSVCIKNYLRVKHICPVDRVELTSSDCRQSSLILRKLVNKLLVSCPHEKFCQKTLQRCDLKDHLQDVCPGAVVRCPKSMYGCAYKASRAKMERHLEDCLFKDFNDKLSDLHPFSEAVTVELFRPEGTAELGIMVVGGSDTPLHYVVIQDVFKDSLAGKDGRLHIGDIFVEINGESMFSVTHAEARAALTKPSNLMRFSLLRDAPTDDKNKESSVTQNDECVCLLKPPLEQLGIRISSSENGENGVFIIELIPGQVAESDGRLSVGDRIMRIGDADLSDSTPEEAARVIGNCDREVKILVRHENAIVVKNDWVENATALRSKKPKRQNSTIANVLLSRPTPLESSHVQKIISVSKSPKENLGIIVSGGNGSPRGNLPIFVQDVLPMSVLGKDSRIRRGDILSEINSIRLTGLSHNQAMSALRDSAQQREVTLVASELEYEGKAEDMALWDELTSLHQNPSKWAPSWKMWLAASREFSSTREIVLRKSSTSNYGFKISGSMDEDTGLSPIFITHVSRSSPASKHLKCGDEIVAINKKPVKDLPYLQVLNLMRTANCIWLKIVSWPGSLH